MLEPTLSRTVLVVEDEELIREMVGEAFRDANLTVVEAESGDAAWDYLNREPCPDLIFTDLSMPGQIDGRELVRLAQERYPQISVVVTSGNAHEAGFKYVLGKPYDLDDAVKLVFHLLDQPAG